MRVMDPTFTRESFERELREYIVPEVVDAYLSADQEALKAWCGEAVSCLIIIYYSLLTKHMRRTTFFGLRWNPICDKVS
jgi:hypothetical protein